MRKTQTYTEGDKVLLRTIKTRNCTWEAGKYVVEKMEVGKSIRYVIPHRSNKGKAGSFLYINQKDTVKRVKLISK